MKKDLQDTICDEFIFKRFFKKHATDLHQFLLYKFGEHLNPKDKVQDAFIKLWEHCGKVSPEKAKSFLFTVANNLMLNETKHQKVKLKYAQKPQNDSSFESPEFLMEEREYLVKLQSALAKLTDAQRSAFMLNRAEGKKYKEIAELLGISVKAVEKRIHGALKQLRKDIKEL